MEGTSMRLKHRNSETKQSGFTMIEMLIATLVMLVGLVGMAQLVPLAIRLNAGNRDDSTALVFAQRELDEMLDQPIQATTFTDPQGVLCPAASTCNLGDPTQPKVLVGSPVVMLNNRPMIDFTQAKVANYSFSYTDPNDPFALPYDIRWAVITYANGANPTGKRFMVGVRRIGGNFPFLPYTLDTMVEK
jgi:prepilin-type N-terminal cleavage/methylation domain-containing protein